MMQQEYSPAGNRLAPPSGSRFIRVLPRFHELSWDGLHWRSLCAAAPALLLLGLASAATQLPPPQPLEAASGAPAANGFAASGISGIENGTLSLQNDTALVTSYPGENVAWKGQLMPMVGVTAKAPVGGQVSRVWAKVGDEVRVGDPILELSSGDASQGPLPVEHRQAQAEQAQVAAAREQAKLQAKIMDARSRLHEAQLRVAAAQRRVDEARRVLEEARGGAASAAPADTRKVAPQTVVKSRSTAAQAARERAADDVREAEAAARTSAQKLQAATRAAEAAQEEAEAAGRKLIQSRRQFAEVQEKFESGEAKGSEVEIARGVVEDAETALQTATSKADSRRAAVEAAREAARVVQKDAENAQQRFAQSVRQLQVFTDNTEKASAATPAAEAAPPARTPRAASTAKARAGEESRPSVAEAARVVRAAIADSRVAIARAEKLKKEVQSYGGRVESVNADLQSSTQQLQIAQQRVIEKTILAKLSVVRAPSTGRVLQVSRVAADVAPGDAVVSISRPDQFKAYFADTSGYWKQLRKGSILPIVVRPSGVAEGAPTASATAGASVTAGASATGGAPATARVESIQPPSAAGQPAIVMVLVSNSAPGGASGGGASGGDASESTPSASALAGIANPHLASGATVVFQAPQSSVALVPEEALLRRADAVLAAVLKPEALSGAYSVEWRFVQPGETNGAQCEVLDGLREGERVVLQPRELYKYSVAQDGPALLRLIS